MKRDPKQTQKVVSAKMWPSDQLAPQLTPSQEAVLVALQQQSQPISVQALHGVMRSQQSIGLATVYRSLDVLQLLGWVQHWVSMDGEKLYSVTDQEHHYLTCLRCGQSVAVESCPVKAFEAELRNAQSFTIYYHTLEFFGLCEPCMGGEELM